MPAPAASSPGSDPEGSGPGFSECLSVVANIFQIVGFFLAIIAAPWAYKQLKAAIASSESQAVLTLDQTPAQYEPLRQELNLSSGFKDDDQDKLIMLRRYIAVFERLGLLLKTGVVNERIADQFYGARLVSLLNNSHGHVEKIITDRGGRGWENFIYLWEQMRKAAPDRHWPDIPRAARL